MATYDISITVVVKKIVEKQISVHADSEEEAMADLQTFYEGVYGDEDIDVEVLVEEITLWEENDD